MARCVACQTTLAEDAASCPSCGAAVSGDSALTAPSVSTVKAPPVLGATMDPNDDVGRVIGGKYEILELVGQGGMGRVYRARHLSLDKIICVKVLKPALLSDETVVGRFEREAKSASRLDHPNSIQVIDFGRDERGTLFIAMEYVAGKDLRRILLDEFPVDEARLCRIMAQVLGALSEAHAKHVIHRDLKPENIMVEQRRGAPDHVKVLDFGIAKIQEPDVPGLTRSDAVCGTPLYMSPEQATGSAFDARADLYAVGVILYQMTTGTLPFDGANSMEILWKHVRDTPVPPRSRRPDARLSPRLEALILKAMSKSPLDRPQTAEAFRHELLAIAAMHEAHQRPASPGRRFSRLSALKLRRGEKKHADPSEHMEGDTDEMLPVSRRAGVAKAVALVAVLGIAAWFAFVPSPDEPVSVPSATPVMAVVDPPKPEPDPEPTPTVKADAPAPAPAPKPASIHEAPRAKPEKPVEPVPVPVAAPEPAPVPAPVSREAAEAARRLLDEADLLFEEERFADAVARYRAAIKSDPSLVKAHRGLFRAGVASGDLDSAKAGGRAYLRLVPEAADAPVVRAQLQQLR